MAKLLKTLSAEVIDRDQFGPAMQKLSRKQQDFVIAYMQSDTQSQAARTAGYKGDSANALRVTAHRLVHNPKVKAALQEYAGNVLTGQGIKKAINRLLDLVDSENEKIALDAVKTLLDRTGIVTATQHNVNVEVKLTQAEKIAKLAELATLAGMDPKQVLGNVVDVEFEDVEDGS